MITWIVFLVLSAGIVAGWAKAYNLLDEGEPPDAFTFACFTYSCAAFIGPLAALMFVVIPHLVGR